MIFLIYGKNVPMKCVLESSVIVSFVEKKFLDLLKHLRALGNEQLWRNFENTKSTFKIPSLKIMSQGCVSTRIGKILMVNPKGFIFWI